MTPQTERDTFDLDLAIGDQVFQCRLRGTRRVGGAQACQQCRLAGARIVRAGLMPLGQGAQHRLAQFCPEGFGNRECFAVRGARPERSGVGVAGDGEQAWVGMAFGGEPAVEGIGGIGFAERQEAREALHARPPGRGREGVDHLPAGQDAAGAVVAQHQAIPV